MDMLLRSNKNNNWIFPTKETKMVVAFILYQIKPTKVKFSRMKQSSKNYIDCVY